MMGMMGFLQFQLGLWVIAGLFALRQLLMVWVAEQGRKHDLVKKLYKNHQAFHVSILVPFLDPDDYPALLTLLQAIHEQDYPADKVKIHLVTHEEGEQHLMPQSLRANVKVWQYPSAGHYEHMLPWLIERCLAAGGNGMFVFLKPTDLVKPDFLQNVVARGIDSFAIQGYVALKNPPRSMSEKVLSLSTRLFNRIGNAGRFHMGLSCRLMDSGWAIKQEVLEMIPFHRGMDMDNLEYSIRLNLENFRVNWAPNVVVYSDSHVSFIEQLTRSVGTFFNRLNLLFQYSPRLLTRMIVRFDFNYLEQLLAIIKPPYMMSTLLLMGLALLDHFQPDRVAGSSLFWTVTVVGALLLNIMGLWVARCKPADYVTMLILTPIVYMLSLLTSPLALFNYFRNQGPSRPSKGNTYRLLQKTRFNEEMAAPPNLFDEAHSQNVIQHVLKKNAPSSPEEMNGLMARAERKPLKRPPMMPPNLAEESNMSDFPSLTMQNMEPAERAKLPRETVKSVPLSNGQKQIPCTLKTLTTFDEDSNEYYQLTLEYKSLSVTTETYRILDQAFYELHAKLMSRGLTIIACGSCGHFYNPTADVPGALRNSGVCLFGKTGREVNLSTDAVTVMSQACSHHCDLSQREHIVRQWKESLALSRVH